MKFKISHLVKTYPITFFAVIALFTASAVTAAKGVLLPLAIGEAALSVVLAVSAILKMHNEFRIIKCGDSMAECPQSYAADFRR